MESISDTNIHIFSDENLASLVPIFEKSIVRSSFISFDTEFTGLPLYSFSSDIQSKYASLRKCVDEYSLLQIGVSLFMSDDLKVIQFEIPLSPIGGFKYMDACRKFHEKTQLDVPKILKFGCVHKKFDYNSPVSQLVQSLISSKKLLVGHNSFIDLLYLYHHFIKPLPEDANDLQSLWTFPTVDTKYLARIYGHNPALTLRDLVKLHYPEMISKEEWHNALFDSYVTGKLYLSLTKSLGEGNECVFAFTKGYWDLKNNVYKSDI